MRNWSKWVRFDDQFALPIWSKTLKTKPRQLVPWCDADFTGWVDMTDGVTTVMQEDGSLYFAEWWQEDEGDNP